jgi:hypothetical protein
MHEGSAKAWLPSKGVAPFLKAILPTCVLRRHGLSLRQHAPRSSPYDTGAGSHASCKLTQDRRGQTAAHGARNCPAVTSTPPLSPRPAGKRVDRHAGACDHTKGVHPFDFDASSMGPRPTRHVTGAPVTTCKKLHRHLRQYRTSSTAEPVPRLETTLRMAQQCQPSTSVTTQSATGEGATVDMAKSRPTVMVAAGGRKQQSSRLQDHVPSWSSRRTLSHGVKTTRPWSVPRTARARTTAAPRTTRPVVLTPQQGRRHPWQAKRATLHLRHNDRVKKGAPHRSISYPFPLPLSLSCYKDRERGYSERDPSPRRKRASSPPTDQRFEGWPLGRVRQPPQSTRAPRPLLVRGSKAGPSEGFDSRLRPLGLRAHY